MDQPNGELCATGATTASSPQPTSSSLPLRVATSKTAPVLVVLIGALAASLWLQRAHLQDCVDTCSCQLFGQDVTVPADANPNCA